MYLMAGKDHQRQLELSGANILPKLLNRRFRAEEVWRLSCLNFCEDLVVQRLMEHAKVGGD